MNTVIAAERYDAPRARRTLILIVLMTLLPVVLAVGMYMMGWQPTHKANRGVLLTPPVHVSNDPVWKGHWSLVLVADAPCGAVCAARLDGLRRVRVALAKEMARTRHVWVGAAIAAEGQALVAANPDLHLVDGRPSSLAGMPAGSVLIVDPLGMAMMRYAPGADLEGIRGDLERLLRFSWIG